MVAFRVRCRSMATRPPPLRSRNRRSNRPSSSAGVMAGTRAAASSMANATPSRRRHTATTSAWLAASISKSALTSRARSANNRTDSHSAASRPGSSSGNPRDGT